MKLPSSTDIERLVLGAILLNESAYVQIAEKLEAEHFTMERHRRIFGRMKDLFERGEHIDHVTVANELISQNQLEAGGISIIASLTEGIPEIANLGSYIAILQDKLVRRKMLHAAKKLALLAQDESEDTEEILSKTLAGISQIGEASSREGATSTSDMIAKDGLDKLLSPRQHGAIHLPFERLDKTLGGLSGGQVIVLLARTSRGKSSFAFQVATCGSTQEMAPIVWTMEMSREECFRSIVQQVSGVWPGSRSLAVEERRALMVAGGQLDEHPIFFDSTSSTVAQFVAEIRRLRSKHRIGLAVVDHLQLIRGGQTRNRSQEVSENSRALKLAARELNIPILVLSQVDRASVKGDGKIGMHSAKESGDIENDADVVMWIEADEDFSWEHDTRVTLHVGKQRNGRAGVKIPMYFKPTRRAFVEAEE